MIKIKMLDKEFTLEEAKELYQELHKLFGDNPFSWKDGNGLDLYSRKEIKPKYDESIFTPLKIDEIKDNLSKNIKSRKNCQQELGYQPIKNSLDIGNPPGSE